MLPQGARRGNPDGILRDVEDVPPRGVRAVDGPLAQRVERRAFNPRVGGSSPSGPTSPRHPGKVSAPVLDPHIAEVRVPTSLKSRSPNPCLGGGGPTAARWRRGRRSHHAPVGSLDHRHCEDHGVRPEDGCCGSRAPRAIALVHRDPPGAIPTSPTRRAPERGDTGWYSILKAYLHPKRRAAREVAVRRCETPLGHQAQVGARNLVSSSGAERPAALRHGRDRQGSAASCREAPDRYLASALNGRACGGYRSGGGGVVRSEPACSRDQGPRPLRVHAQLGAFTNGRGLATGACR